MGLNQAPHNHLFGANIQLFPITTKQYQKKAYFCNKNSFNT